MRGTKETFGMHRSTKLIGAIILGGALTGGLITTAAAQDASPADHPIVGAWMAQTPGGPSVAVFSSDGTVVMGTPASSSGPMGVVFVSTEVGTWEAIDGHTAHFTAVQFLSDADGAFGGSLTFEGYPAISEDGQTLLDENTRGGVTVRDATNAVLSVNEGGPPITGVRMAVGAPGFPEPDPAAASPAP
jgi:hypothetical protein